jgi:anthranilate phosphoribosyltransferase
MKDVLNRLLDGDHLTEDEAAGLMTALAEDRLPGAVAGAFLAGLRLKRETAEEIRGFARAMRGLARRPDLPDGIRPVDVVGTGGDGSGSLNLSTGSALLAAACGLPVVKHGNRSVSSRCGSADVLEALGLGLPLDERAAGRCLRETGFAFLFAPHYHPAMKALVPVRKALGVRTVFNILGPLTNPAEPPFMVVGAFSPQVAELMAQALSGLPIERAFVVHGEPGWDEATPCGPFLLFDVRPGSVEREERDPADAGLPRCNPRDLAGGDAADNAAALRDAITGTEGPHLDALALGAGLALEVSGSVATMALGVAAARAAVQAGDGGRLLERIGRFGDGEGIGEARHSDFLSRMVAGSNRRVRDAMAGESPGNLRLRALETPVPPGLGPAEPPGAFDLLAEVKRRAPSGGSLRAATTGEVAELAAGYARAGAVAISILTEPEEFGGDLADLRAAASAAPTVPVMRKDFVTHPYQVYEARAAGAGGVLLILRILDSATLAECVKAAAECGLFVLLEAFDEADLQRAGPAAELCRREGTQVLVGLNCRDLATLDVDISRFADLIDRFPRGVRRVAESGVLGPAEARRIAALGYDAVLVGSALMRSEDPPGAAAEMLAAARDSVLGTGSVWVKICGLNSAAAVLAVTECGADAAGFVFADSPRRVSPGRAHELAALLPPNVERVAVFHNASADRIGEVLSEFEADIVQCEPVEEAIEAVVERGTAFLPVLHDRPDLDRQADVAAALQGGAAPAAVLEAAGKGGSGARPDWNRAAALARRIPLVLAGGLGPDNVADAILAVRPYGVDVSSGVEARRGVKDPVRIAAFVEAARTAAAAVGAESGDRNVDLAEAETLA